MNPTIKKKINILLQSCELCVDTLKNIGADPGSLEALKTICKTELMAFSFAISSQYETIGLAEVQRINYYFNEDFPEHLERFSFSDQLQQCRNYLMHSDWLALKFFIMFDNFAFEQSGDKDISIVSMYLPTLIDLKNDILGCSGNGIDPSRISTANRYINFVKYKIKKEHNFWYYVDGMRDEDLPNNQSDNTPSKMTFFDNIEPKNQKKELEEHKEPKENLESLLLQLNGLIGLSNIKSDVASIVNLIKINKLREERGIAIAPMSLHMVFSGNPGTGKTTVARLLGKIYKCLGVLSKGHLIEVDRSGLVGGYVGQTALKVQEVIQSALGGILFIDEAYSLVNKGSNDYGTEAIDTLVKGMEDNRDNLIVIVAGYPDLMDDFLNSNPGLRSRFNKFFLFPDYSPTELLDIFKMLVEEKGYHLSSVAVLYAKQYFSNQFNSKDTSNQNARGVRNFFEKAIINQANRLSQVNGDLTNELLTTIELSDINSI